MGDICLEPSCQFHGVRHEHESAPSEASATHPPMLFGYPVIVGDFHARRRDGSSYEWRLRATDGDPAEREAK